MSRRNYSTAFHSRVRRAIIAVQVIVLGGAGFVGMINPSTADAAQLTNRSITLSTTQVSTSSTYSVAFRPTVTTAIEGIVVEFCQNSPLVGASCTTTNGVTASPTSSTVTVSQTGATPASVIFNVNAASVNTGRLILTHATGFTAPVTGADMTFSFTATNPSNNGTFYARILTYTDETVADDYTSATPGTHLDDGGIALSTANQLTINARVQEVLQFCVGTDDASSANDCTDISGTTVDLGVVDSSQASISPVSVAAGGNNKNGLAMIRTNASNGASVTYYAEQDTTSGTLKVAGQSCDGDTTYATGSTTDKCFNATNTQTSFATTGFEGFGVTSTLDTSNGTTTNLTRNTEYDGDGTAAVGFAWNSSTTATQLASSTTVVDDEMLVLRFAARAAVTTPTGQYGVTSTYIATATF